MLSRIQVPALACVQLLVYAVSTFAQTPQLMVVRLSVNQVEIADVVIQANPPDLLVRVQDLENAGLRDFTGERSTMDGESYVSLRSLAPALTYELDEKELTLKITAGEGMFGKEGETVDLRAPHPSGIEYGRDTSAFLNYAVTERTGAPLSVIGEAAVSLGGPLLLSSFSQSGGRYFRGLNSLTFDQREKLRRWVIGDTPPGTVSAVNGLPLMGISVSRNFGLDPYFIRFPGFGISTNVDTPSTLEVYANGRLVYQEQVRPGPLDLRNLPAVQGNASFEIVLRDAFGRERRIVSQFYLATRLLTRGLSEYSYNVGFVRQQAGLTSTYGQLAFLGSHRIGISDALTAGFHLETLDGLFNAGPSIATRRNWGEVEVSLAGSTLRGRPGAAALLTYRYVGRRTAFGGLLRARSIHSPSFDLTLLGRPPVHSASLFMTRPLGNRASLSVQYSASRLPYEPWSSSFSIVSSGRITSRISMIASATVSPESGRNNNSAFIGVNYMIGPFTVASGGVSVNGGGAQSNVQMIRSLPRVGNGFGYRIQSQDGPSDQVSGLLQYQGPYGRYETTFNNAGGTALNSFTASGSLVALGGQVHFAQPIQDSYGVVRLPGLPGVRGYLDNQVVGRTDSRGNLIIPALLSYYGNRVTINPEQLPVNSSIGITEKLIAPPYRGGALISFPVQRVQVVTGKVVILIGDAQAGVSAVPSYGDLTVTVEGQANVSPIGTKGQFYFENLPAGRHPAKVEGGDQDCEFTLNVPSSDSAFLDLGTIKCISP